jgi:nucleoid DNA-binding protein
MDTKEKIAAAIKNQLIQQSPVRIGGLGVLKTAHHTAREVKTEQGEIRLIPPSISVVFEAE